MRIIDVILDALFGEPGSLAESGVVWLVCLG
jgi:hypothetical protein